MSGAGGEVSAGRNPDFDLKKVGRNTHDGAGKTPTQERDGAADARKAEFSGERRTGAKRTYVTAVLVGGCLLISLFQSKTSDMVCNKLKETIAYQISTEEVQKWKSRGAALRKGVEESLPVFREKQERDERVYRPDTEESP